MILLWYLVLAIVAWISFWLFVYFYPATMLCPQCGGELQTGFLFGRGQRTYCRRCSYER